MDRTGLELILGFSDGGKEACRALGFNEGAFGSDFDFLRCLSEELYDGNQLEWKLEKGHITREGTQVAMDSLRKLPNIPIVLSIIEEMRRLLARLGIDEVSMEKPAEPKMGDRLLVKIARGEMTVDINDVKDGFVHFNLTGGKRTRIDNLKFTRNLQIGSGVSFSVGEGWMIMDHGKIEDEES